MGIGDVLQDFANWSTIAGVPHIANAKNWIVRLFWTIVFCILMGLFIFQLYGMISNFLSFPSSISTEIAFDQQIFPAVTICNLNPYKVKNTGLTAFDTELQTFMDYYATVVDETATTNPYGIQGLPSSFDRDIRAGDVVNMIAGKYSPDIINSSLYTYDEIIADCSFNGISCSESDFTTFVDNVYGRCFTYNNLVNSTLSVSRAGKTYGLSLLITVHQTDINDTVPLYYPLHTTAGAKVAIHAPTEYPNLEGQSLTVGVGLTTAVSITSASYTLAKKPYGQCVDSEDSDTNYYTGYKYTSLTCYNGCRQRAAYTRCGCHNPRYHAPSNASFCTPTVANVGCLDGLRGDQKSTTEKNLNPSTDCNCKPACDERTFTLTTSLSEFPAAGYIVVSDGDDTSNVRIGSCTADNTKFATTDECQEWYTNNALQLQVFFESMRREAYAQSSSYGLSTMVNELGGQAGLYLGLSIISIIEFFGLFLLLVAYCISGGSVEIHPYDDDFEKDHRIREIEDLRRELDDHNRMDQKEIDVAARRDSNGDEMKTESDEDSDEEKESKKEEPKIESNDESDDDEKPQKDQPRKEDSDKDSLSDVSEGQNDDDDDDDLSEISDSDDDKSKNKK